MVRVIANKQCNPARIETNSGISYVDVVVGLRTDNLGDTFTYSSPTHLGLEVGHQVRVPFGAKEISGVVVALKSHTQLEYTKPVTSLVHQWPVISKIQIDLARWISSHYQSPIYQSISLMMPPGQSLRNVQKIRIRRGSLKPDTFTNEGEKRLYEYLEKRNGPVSARTLERRLGSWAKNALSDLNRKNLLEISERTSQHNNSLIETSEEFIALSSNIESVRQWSNTQKRRAPRMAEVSMRLTEIALPVSLKDARKMFGSPALFSF